MTTMAADMLTAEQVGAFARDGVVVVRGFYDTRREIEPIQRAVYQIIGLVAAKHGIAIGRRPYAPDAFDDGFNQLIARDRSIGGEVYDAVKQIPAFVRLVACEKNEAVLRQLRASDLPGVAAGGYGIRIDNPNEERYRAPWHQEYPAQLRSLDGVVFWSPLVPMTAALGPVEICLGSHKVGPVRVHGRDPRNPEKTGAYALILENEANLISRYARAAPLTMPGDVVLIDFLTLHQSGLNAGNRSRWSMQFRLFNFREPTGIRIGWKGSYAAGVDFRSIHPELMAD